MAHGSLPGLCHNPLGFSPTGSQCYERSRGGGFGAVIPIATVNIDIELEELVVQFKAKVFSELIIDTRRDVPHDRTPIIRAMHGVGFPCIFNHRRPQYETQTIFRRKDYFDSEYK